MPGRISSVAVSADGKRFAPAAACTKRSGERACWYETDSGKFA